MNPRIYICQSDANRLNSLLNAPQLLQKTDETVAERLRQELARAAIVPDSELPETVIALNSTAELEDLTHHEVDQFTLVLPGQADIQSGRISILAPLGVGMLGFKAGDEFEWSTPGGIVRYRVRRVMHPAAGRKVEPSNQNLSNS